MRITGLPAAGTLTLQGIRNVRIGAQHWAQLTPAASQPLFPQLVIRGRSAAMAGNYRRVRQLFTLTGKFGSSNGLASTLQLCLRALKVAQAVTGRGTAMYPCVLWYAAVSSLFRCLLRWLRSEEPPPSSAKEPLRSLLLCLYSKAESAGWTALGNACSVVASGCEAVVDAAASARAGAAQAPSSAPGGVPGWASLGRRQKQQKAKAVAALYDWLQRIWEPMMGFDKGVGGKDRPGPGMKELIREWFSSDGAVEAASLQQGIVHTALDCFHSIIRMG